MMDTETLNILADAISEVGVWQWWQAGEDGVQLEFGGVTLYDETKAEKAPHSGTIALRFRGNAFAVFLDDLEEDGEKKWYERFRDDEIAYFPVETFDFGFDDIGYAKTVLGGYRNRTPILGVPGADAFGSAKHLLAAKCGDVGFAAGGDELAVIGRKGLYAPEEIVAGAKRWWAYWRDYWRLRKTKGAYEKDWACEATIPSDRDHPTGNWYEEEQTPPENGK